MAASLFGPVRSACAEPIIVDAVLATVDKEVVLKSELMNLIGRELDEIGKSSVSSAEKNAQADSLVKEALDQSINARLLAREAKKDPKFEVADKDLDYYVENARKNYVEKGKTDGKTEEDFIKEVTKEFGSMSDFREHGRQMILAQRMQVSKMESFESQVVVSEDEVNSYYQAHLKDYESPERVYLRQIFIRVQNGDAERAQAHAKLQSLRDEIVAGTNFNDLAKLHSQGPEAAEGGAVGWQQKGDLVEPLNTAAFSLSAGGVSEVIDSQFGVHLLKADKHEQAGTRGLAEVRLDIEKQLREDAAKKKYNTWLADLRKRSRVRIFL